MARFTSPGLIVLRVCELPHLRNHERTKAAIQTIAEWNPGWQFRPEDVPMPVVLRWSTNPVLGFPLRPFEVYRRTIKEHDLRVFIRSPQNVEGSVVLDWGLRELYVVAFQVSVTPGAPLTIEALNAAGQPIPGLRQSFTTNDSGSFTGSGIAALRASGSGRVESVRGVLAEEVAALPDWELIELIGLPLRVNEVGNGYDTTLPQGVVNPMLDGYDAAAVRLMVANILSDPPPSTGDPTIPTPAWGFPDPFAYRFVLCDQSPSTMDLVRACLESTDNRDPNNQQSDFIVGTVIPGPRQSNMPGATPSASLATTEMNIPVVGVTLLSAAVDSFAATGLGYGTIDFPTLLQQEEDVSALALYQYMVVGEYETLFGRRELAALSTVALPPGVPSGLQARSVFQNRPNSVDGALSESVELSWLLPPILQGYGIAVSRSDGDVTLLNEPHRDGWHLPYTPEYPYPQNGTIPAGSRGRFADNDAPVPDTGSQLSEYIVAGLDVFGRWSAWRKVTHSASPPPVQKPGIHSVNFVKDGSPAADGTIPYIIEIEFSWNQEDRRVHAIDFFARYFTLVLDADPGSAPATLQFSNTLAGTAPLRLLFNASGIPRLPAGSPFSIDLPVVNVPLNPPDPDLLKFVLRLRGARVQFAAGTTKIGYAVYAVARERVREPNPNSDMAVSLPSQPTAAMVTTVIDPRRPDMPILTPSLNWTALPDATGRARGVLTWPAVDRAVGYVVWQATESALLQAMNPPVPEPAPGTPLLTRAGALQTLLSNTVNQRQALRVFSRLNTELVRATSLEIELPAAASTLFAFRVSAVGENNESSDRSAGMVIFGVPKRNQPGRPRLLLRAAPGGGVYVICIAAAGVEVDGFQIFRVRTAALLIDAGSYGAPHLTASTPGWHDLDALPAAPAWNPVRAAIRTLPGPLRGRAIFDPAPSSWRPYYYAAVALGVENRAAGDYPGESPPSASQEITLPPPNPPTLVITGFGTAADGSKMLTFTTALPVRPLPLGLARLVLYQVRIVDNRARRELLLDETASEVIEGSLPATGVPLIRRGAPDAAGVVAYEARLPDAVEGGVVVVTDPLGRAVERLFPT